MSLGDSNTLGYPCRKYAGGYRLSLWHKLNQLAEISDIKINFVGRRKHGPRNIEQNHEGWGGFSIEQLIGDSSSTTVPSNEYGTVETALLTGNPNLVLLMAGTNNIIKGDTAATALNELEKLVDRITATLTDAQVLVASLIPNYSSIECQVKTEQFSQGVYDTVVAPRINAQNGNKVGFVDIFGTSRKTLVLNDFSPDGYHLRASGYDKIADIWYRAIAANLGLAELAHRSIVSPEPVTPVKLLPFRNAFKSALKHKPI